MSYSRKDWVPYEDLVTKVAKKTANLYKTESAATIRKVVESATGKNAKVRALRAVESMPSMFKALYTEADMAKSVLPIVRQAVFLGAKSFSSSDSIYRSEAEFQKVTEGFEEHFRFYADNYVSRIVVPRLRKVVLDSESPEELQVELKKAADRLLAESQNYWTIVAHGSISNSFHYGLLKTAEIAGMRNIMYLAVRDDRTTDFCNHIDGQTVALTPVLKKLMEYAYVSGPSVKKALPWSEIQKLKNPTPGKLIKKGMPFPPFHAHCRTTFHIF